MNYNAAQIYIIKKHLLAISWTMLHSFNYQTNHYFSLTKHIFINLKPYANMARDPYLLTFESILIKQIVVNTLMVLLQIAKTLMEQFQTD